MSVKHHPPRCTQPRTARDNPFEKATDAPPIATAPTYAAHGSHRATTGARTFTQALGGHFKNGRGQAPCPVCQPERRPDQIALSITEQGGKLLLHCFKSQCGFAEIARMANLPLDAAQSDRVAQRLEERKRAAYQAEQLARARSLWEDSRSIEGTRAETYLRGRGITCALPDSLRFQPDIYHAPSGSWGCAMVANVDPTGGIHRTFFDNAGNRLAKNAKMMLGPCGGGAVRLSESDGPLVVSEGIETGLSLLSGLLRRPATVWATLSTSGMKALDLPPEPHRLTIATDGEDAGRQAGNALAARATALGWTVSLLPAPDRQDWNDVLMEKGASIWPK